MVRLRKKRRPDSVVAYICACITECSCSCLCVCTCDNQYESVTQWDSNGERDWHGPYLSDYDAVREMRNTEHAIFA